MSVRNRIQSARRIRITLNCGVITPASLLIKATKTAKRQQAPSGLGALSYISVTTYYLSPVSQAHWLDIFFGRVFCHDFDLQSISVVAALRVSI